MLLLLPACFYHVYVSFFDTGGSHLISIKLVFYLFSPLSQLGPKGYCRTVSAAARTHSFGYYANMVQLIKFIIHINIQPVPALFTQGQGHRPKSKILKKSC